MGFDTILRSGAGGYSLKREENGASKLFYQVEEKHVRKLIKSEVNKQQTKKQKNKLV